MSDNSWRQPYRQSLALSGYVKEGGRDPDKVEELWHRAFCCIAKYLGFNRPTRRILWHELAVGNWKHLHKTTKEEAKAADEWLEDFRWDVIYCSDRWSLDRLTRCHWLYRQYRWAIRKERLHD